MRWSPRVEMDGTFTTPVIPPGERALRMLEHVDGRWQTRTKPITGEDEIEFDLR